MVSCSFLGKHYQHFPRHCYRKANFVTCKSFFLFKCVGSCLTNTRISTGGAVASLAWLYGWMEIPTSSFRIALVPPYLILMNILTGRVHRNTKLGLYSNVNLETLPRSNDLDLKSQTHATINEYNSHFSRAVMPIQIAITQVDYSEMKSRGSVDVLDFGMV